MSHLSRRQKQFLLLYIAAEKEDRNTRKVWVRPQFLRREMEGVFFNTVEFLRETDPAGFRDFLRMSPEQFDYLLDLVKEDISPSKFCVREPIAAKDRLSIALRFLASGDSMASLSFFSGVSKTSISRFVFWVCNALWDKLSPLVLPSPTKETWERVGRDMESKWQFPNCVGAIDGKHIVMQAPPKSGSAYFNYKGSHSIVLLGVCDADYKFTVVDIGGSGRNSDGGIFNHSDFGQALHAGDLDLPQPKFIAGRPHKMPHVFVADEAFPLKKNLMRPFPGRNLLYKQKVFNYRLSRCRRLIENTFGIMASRFRVFRKPINCHVKTVESITKACVCLHNYLKANDDTLPASRRIYCPLGYADEDVDGDITTGWWRDSQTDALLDLQRVPYRNTLESREVREEFGTFFLEEGELPWQRQSVTSTS